MAPQKKAASFFKQGNDWYYSAGLPSDVTVSVDGVSFHLHKFPLVAKCGKIAQLCGESLEKGVSIELEEFPGGPETFLVIAKFCYGLRLELSPRNIVIVYCGADYLEMTDEYEEDNLLSQSESFLQKNILCNWKDCILALQSSDPVFARAEKLRIIKKCLDSISMMACTDPSLFGWPMLMYGSLQSPGGSILWNGIHTGAKIQSTETDWWFEDISYLSVNLFERLLRTMQRRGIRPENLAGAIVYYARKYLPGLGRWQGGHKTRTVASFSLKPATVDQRVLVETIVELLPDKKGKSFCRFLAGLLRIALILGVSQACIDSLEQRIGVQLDAATLDSLLIPTYSDSDTLYNSDSAERMIHHFTSSESRATTFSPSSLDLEASPSSGPLRKVAKLVDSYMAEVASDVNMKPGKIRSLAEALPESSRELHDGLYRAIDIYITAHPWLSDKEKEDLCNVIDYQKLSIDACTHASQNDRLPLRVVLQVLFFEQMQLRSALAGCFQTLDAESAPMHVPSDTAGQIVQRDGWVSVVRENQVLKVNMENMRSRIGELEEEFSKIKQEMKRVSKSHSHLSSPRLVRRIGCKLISQSSDVEPDTINSTCPTTPRASSVEQPRTSRLSRHRKSFSVL